MRGHAYQALASGFREETAREFIEEDVDGRSGCRVRTGCREGRQTRLMQGGGEFRARSGGPERGEGGREVEAAMVVIMMSRSGEGGKRTEDSFEDGVGLGRLPWLRFGVEGEIHNHMPFFWRCR